MGVQQHCGGCIRESDIPHLFVRSLGYDAGHALSCDKSEATILEVRSLVLWCVVDSVLVDSTGETTDATLQ